MTAQEVAEAMGSRRTVRVTYHREEDYHSVDLVLGDKVLQTLVRYRSETLAEEFAGISAMSRGLDISRLDVD